MLDRFLDKKRNLYALAIVAIVFESLSSTVLKLGGQYPFLSTGYLFFFCLAVGIMALYAVAWQLLLERLPLARAGQVSAIVSACSCGLLLLLGAFWSLVRRAGLWPLGMAAYLTVRLLLLARRAEAAP